MTELTQSYDPIDVGSAIEKLHSIGFFPDQIAMILDKPVRVVREVISRQPVPDDRELADDVKRLCQTAIRRAHFMLDYGTGEERMRITMACINGSTRMLQAAAQASGEETKLEFLRLMTRMRDVPARETIVTAESGAIDVTARPASERTEDQD